MTGTATYAIERDKKAVPPTPVSASVIVDKVSAMVDQEGQVFLNNENTSRVAVLFTVTAIDTNGVRVNICNGDATLDASSFIKLQVLSGYKDYKISIKVKKR